MQFTQLPPPLLNQNVQQIVNHPNQTILHHVPVSMQPTHQIQIAPTVTANSNFIVNTQQWQQQPNSNQIIHLTQPNAAGNQNILVENFQQQPQQQPQMQIQFHQTTTTVPPPTVIPPLMQHQINMGSGESQFASTQLIQPQRFQLQQQNFQLVDMNQQKINQQPNRPDASPSREQINMSSVNQQGHDGLQQKQGGPKNTNLPNNQASPKHNLGGQQQPQLCQGQQGHGGFQQGKGLQSRGHGEFQQNQSRQQQQPQEGQVQNQSQNVNFLLILVYFATFKNMNFLVFQRTDQNYNKPNLKRKLNLDDNGDNNGEPPEHLFNPRLAGAAG